MPDSVSNGTFVAYLADDGDTKAISYSGQWAHITSAWNGSYLDTGSTGAVGSQASITFKGSIFAAAAAIPSGLTDADAANPPNVTISIDGGAPMLATAGIPTDDAPFLYVNKTLPIGQHTAVLTVAAQTDAFPFGLDLFVYAGPDDVTVPIGATQALGDGNSDEAGTTGFLQGLLPQIEKAQQAKSSDPPVGPIVGGVIGGVALLAIISLVVWYMFIRPRRRGGRPFFYAPAKISDMLSSETADAKPEPFTLFQPTTGADSPSMSQVPRLAPQRRPTAAPSDLEDGPVESVSGSSGYGYGVGMAAASQPEGKDEKAGAFASPPPATYHADSGVRFGGGEALSDVPPTYSQK